MKTGNAISNLKCGLIDTAREMYIAPYKIELNTFQFEACQFQVTFHSNLQWLSFQSVLPIQIIEWIWDRREDRHNENMLLNLFAFRGDPSFLVKAIYTSIRFDLVQLLHWFLNTSDHIMNILLFRF